MPEWLRPAGNFFESFPNQVDEFYGNSRKIPFVNLVGRTILSVVRRLVAAKMLPPMASMTGRIARPTTEFIPLKINNITSLPTYFGKEPYMGNRRG
ncbi:MAG: hypothetical protein V3S46_07745 [Nitrospinota bacterium]